MVEKDDTIIEGKMETAELDWPRIRHLMKLGLLAGCMNLAGDLLLGYHGGMDQRRQYLDVRRSAVHDEKSRMIRKGEAQKYE